MIDGRLMNPRTVFEAGGVSIRSMFRTIRMASC